MYSLQQKLEHVIARLTKFAAPSRPRKIRTLQSTLNAMLGKELDESKVKEVMDKLIANGVVIPGPNDSVTYQL